MECSILNIPFLLVSVGLKAVDEVLSVDYLRHDGNHETIITPLNIYL